MGPNDPNLLLSNSIKISIKKKTRRFRLKEAGGTLILYLVLNMSLIIAASGLRSVQLDSHEAQHCPQRLHYTQIKIK